ncbi:MAG: B12-binding domain-containing radical SAM protein [Syntrophales bacterium]
MIEPRVLLFNPPAPDGRAYTREGRCTQEAGVWGTQWPPLSLATAAALLRQDGHRVTLRDYPAAGRDSRALAKDLRELRPAFAIWSTGTPTLRHDVALARLVREETPAAVTAVIGTHVTVRPEEALAEPALGAVIRGEPEGIIRQLCRSSGDFRQVDGISWREGPGDPIRHNPDAAPLAPEAIPAADWDGLDLDDYRLPLKGRRFLIVAPVRGCPWRCTFCTAPLYYGAQLRRRPVAAVVAEMAANAERYGIREFFIWADTFTADREYVRELCRAIVASGLKVSWTCNSRVDTIDEETLRLMKQAGLWMISYGLESGSDAVLAASRKGITVAQSRAAVELAHRLGIRVAGHFMFGLPGETEATMAETLGLALALPIDIAQFYVAAPFPGTALYDEARGKGWLRESVAASQSSAVMELPGLSPARVDAFRRTAFRRFYLRPQAAARVLAMAEPSAAANVLAPVRRFLRWLG